MVRLGGENVEVFRRDIARGAVAAIDKIDDELVALPLVEVLAVDNAVGESAEVAVHAASGGQVDGPLEGVGAVTAVIAEGLVGGEAGGGIREQVAGGGAVAQLLGDDDQLQVGVLGFEGFGNDEVCGDAFGGGVVEVGGCRGIGRRFRGGRGFGSRVRSRGRSCRCRRRTGSEAGRLAIRDYGGCDGVVIVSRVPTGEGRHLGGV